MALSQAARALNSSRAPGLTWKLRDRSSGAVWAAFLTVVIASPWVQVGYIFGTDWPGPRRFDWPTAVSSLAPIQVILDSLSRIMSAQLTGKLFVFALLFIAAFLAFRAVPTDGFVPKAAGAALYVFNPFVFGRLHYGQFYLLAGYALLPWAAIRLRELCARPRWRAGVLLGVSASLVAVFTVHLLLVFAVLAAVVAASYVVAVKDRAVYVKRLLTALASAGATAILLCSYWAIPFLLGRGVEAAVIGGTSTGQLNAYAVVQDQTLGLLPNLLGLYGFWAENSGRFTSMKAFVPAWPLVLAIVLGVAAIGTYVSLRRKESGMRPWVAGLVIAAVLTVLLEMGVSSPLTAGFVRWLDSTIPLYKGMRDAGKWAALLALVYSQLFGLGTAAVLDWIRKLRLPTSQLEWVTPLVMGLLIALPLYYGNGLLFGIHGEIKPSDYPAGWYAADRALSADPHPDRTLFLPWHEYMAYTFIRNQNKVVACPAPTFFSVPILSSANPEVAGIPAPGDSEQVAISNLVAAGQTGQWAAILAAGGVKYVLVAKEVDWASYRYLGSEPGLVLVADYVSIQLYRNTLIPDR